MVRVIGQVLCRCRLSLSLCERRWVELVLGTSGGFVQCRALEIVFFACGVAITRLALSTTTGASVSFD